MRTLLAVVLCGATVLVAPHSNAAHVRITKDQARTIALEKVGGNGIDSGELVRRHGKWVYAFEVRTTAPGITRVQVNAITGKIVSVTATKETTKEKAARN